MTINIKSVVYFLHAHHQIIKNSLDKTSNAVFFTQFNFGNAGKEKALPREM